jgi:hypothetical protein
MLMLLQGMDTKHPRKRTAKSQLLVEYEKKGGGRAAASVCGDEVKALASTLWVGPRRPGREALSSPVGA